MREEDTVCVGSDGLQYCKVCGEAKEAFFLKGGFMGMKKHSRQCACDRKAYEEEQKYFRDKEHRELVSRNTSICFDESRMEEWTFENADMSDAVMHKAKNYVDNWEKMKRNHIGCLFWGPVGTGKSYIAGCIANDLLKREVTVKMTNFNTIIDDIFPLADKTEYINALASYQLLSIDDLGVERNSEYALGIIFSVIDRRIRSGRPLIITTNLPLKEIKSETMLDKRRIYDRILEMCTPMYVGGTSKRDCKYENGESENAVEYKQRGGGMRMNHTEKTIPVWKKYSLNVSEAAEYYGIGEKRLRQIAGENEGADFILEVGSHIRFKRKLFEDYLDTASTV